VGSLTVNLAQTMQQDRLRFPGMLPREILIWKSWLKLYEFTYERFEYNVRVGEGFDPGPSWPEEHRRGAIMNSQKRIDVVGWDVHGVTLFEVKDRAGASALGQLLTYCPLWAKLHPSEPGCRMALVTNRLQHDILPAVEQHGIMLFQVYADFSQLARTRRAGPFLSKSPKPSHS
jgi:hypothetical protein